MKKEIKPFILKFPNYFECEPVFKGVYFEINLQILSLIIYITSNNL